jgi:hypothetical protein
MRFLPPKQNFWAETKGVKYIVESLGSRTRGWDSGSCHESLNDESRDQ